MKILVLESGKANHEYYHYTDVNGLIGIIQSNELIGSLESEGILKDKFTVSFSRLGKGTQVDSNIVKSPTIVKIIFDGEKLADNYRIIPYDWYGGDTRSIGKSENEEAIILNKKSGNKVSVEITDKGRFFCKIIFIKNSDDLFEIKDVILEKGKAKNLSGTKWKFPDNLIYSIQYMEKEFDLEVGVILNPKDNPDLKGLKKPKILRGFIKLEDRNPSITNIKKYIKGVQFSDKLEDNNHWKYFAWSPVEYLERELIQKSSKGLSGDSSGFKVSHNIKTYQELKNFLDSKGILYSYYKSPKRGFKKVN